MGDEGAGVTDREKELLAYAERQWLARGMMARNALGRARLVSLWTVLFGGAK